MCGIVGVVSNRENVAEDIRLGLWSLQHRGQESTGIVTYTGSDYWLKKEMGMVDFVFHDDAPLDVPGKSGIGHVRYSTCGSSSIENAQPIEGKFRGAKFWLSHNGNLVNARAIRNDLENQGYIFKTTTDTEVIAGLIHFSKQEFFSAALKESLLEVRGTYSLLALYKDDVYGVRDPTANLPLVIGHRDGVMLLASESATCDVLGATFLREVEPGELVTLRSIPFSLWSERFFGSLTELLKNQRPCIFEFVYFLRPDSIMNGRRVDIVREEIGRELWRQAPADADVVIPVPDSANSIAAGLAREAGLPLEQGLFRYHYVGRSFTKPKQKQRERVLRIKLNPIPERFAGKRAIVVDDSIVRSTSIKWVIKILRDNGVGEVHVRIGSPPYMWPCYYGKDTNQVEGELFSKRHGGNAEAIRQEIGADSLGYLNLAGLTRSVLKIKNDDLDESNFCNACFSGDYHIPIVK